MSDPAELRWYIARTGSHQEKLARASLAAEGFKVYLPLTPRKNKRGEIYGAPLFPSYVFVRIALGMEGWTRVFSTRGVAAVLGTGGRPTPLGTAVIAVIKSREVDGFVRLGLAQEEGPAFEHGQTVTIKKGPYAAIDAIFLEKIDSRRCAVLLKLLGDSRIAHAQLAHLE